MGDVSLDGLGHTARKRLMPFSGAIDNNKYKKAARAEMERELNAYLDEKYGPGENPAREEEKKKLIEEMEHKRKEIPGPDPLLVRLDAYHKRMGDFYADVATDYEKRRIELHTVKELEPQFNKKFEELFKINNKIEGKLTDEQRAKMQKQRAEYIQTYAWTAPGASELEVNTAKAKLYKTAVGVDGKVGSLDKEITRQNKNNEISKLEATAEKNAEELYRLKNSLTPEQMTDAEKQAAHGEARWQASSIATRLIKANPSLDPLEAKKQAWEKVINGDKDDPHGRQASQAERTQRLQKRQTEYDTAVENAYNAMPDDMKAKKSLDQFKAESQKTLNDIVQRREKEDGKGELTRDLALLEAKNKLEEDAKAYTTLRGKDSEDDKRLENAKVVAEVLGTGAIVVERDEKTQKREVYFLPPEGSLDDGKRGIIKRAEAIGVNLTDDQIEPHVQYQKETGKFITYYRIADEKMTDEQRAKLQAQIDASRNNDTTKDLMRGDNGFAEKVVVAEAGRKYVNLLPEQVKLMAEKLKDTPELKAYEASTKEVTEAQTEVDRLTKATRAYDDSNYTVDRHSVIENATKKLRTEGPIPATEVTSETKKWVEYATGNGSHLDNANGVNAMSKALAAYKKNGGDLSKLDTHEKQWELLYEMQKNGTLTKQESLDAMRVIGGKDITTADLETLMKPENQKAFQDYAKAMEDAKAGATVNPEKFKDNEANKAALEEAKTRLAAAKENEEKKGKALSEVAEKLVDRGGDRVGFIPLKPSTVTGIVGVDGKEKKVEAKNNIKIEGKVAVKLKGGEFLKDSSGNAVVFTLGVDNKGNLQFKDKDGKALTQDQLKSMGVTDESLFQAVSPVVMNRNGEKQQLAEVGQKLFVMDSKQVQAANVSSKPAGTSTGVTL